MNLAFTQVCYLAYLIDRVVLNSVKLVKCITVCELLSELILYKFIEFNVLYNCRRLVWNVKKMSKCKFLNFEDQIKVIQLPESEKKLGDK